MLNVETVDVQQRRNSISSDPLYAVRRESTERMRTALLSYSLDDPYSAAFAIKQVTLLRVSHQVARIVQYLDMMDRIEEKLYIAINNELEAADLYDPMTLNHLLAIQSKLQETIIESNKLLTPYLNMEQYPAFENIEQLSQPDEELLSLPAKQRDELRENASAILAELNTLSKTEEVVEG